MQISYIPRSREKKVIDSLKAFPAVAILGPRQSGKSTLAKAIMAGKSDAVYLDLERPSDLRKLAEPELFFELNKGKLICLDEIQRTPRFFWFCEASIHNFAHSILRFFLLIDNSMILLPIARFQDCPKNQV